VPIDFERVAPDIPLTSLLFCQRNRTWAWGASMAKALKTYGMAFIVIPASVVRVQ